MKRLDTTPAFYDMITRSKKLEYLKSYKILILIPQMNQSSMSLVGK